MIQASNIKTLVVDDQLTMRALIRSALQQIGFKDIAEVSDGEEALREILVAKPNLVISDFNMPKMDGLTLLRAVRSQEAVRKTPFVMVTGRADRELVQRAMQHGVNNYIMKPFSPAALRQKLEEVFGPIS